MEVASGAVVFSLESLQSWLCTGSDLRSWWHSQELKSAGGLPVPWRQQWQTLELRGFSPSLTRAATRGETFNFYHRPDQYHQYAVNTERFYFPVQEFIRLLQQVIGATVYCVILCSKAAKNNNYPFCFLGSLEIELLYQILNNRLY